MNGRNVEDVNHDTVLKYIAEGKIGAPFVHLYLIEDFNRTAAFDSIVSAYEKHDEIT